MPKFSRTIVNCNLENVNYVEGKTYPSIDLRDKYNKIDIQVTSTSDFEKIKYTLSKFIEKNIHKEFDKIYVFIITNKKSKYDQNKIDAILKGKFIFKVDNIIDGSDIYKELNSQNNLKKINIVGQFLEEQFADQSKLDKWDIYCKGLNEYDSSIIQLSTMISSQENKGEKMIMLYDFLTSNEFRLQVEAIVEGFTQLLTKHKITFMV